jgi:hypothetical protein
MKSFEKLISSSSLEYMPSEILLYSVGLLDGLNLRVLRPSKQSPMNSQTLGGFWPLERIVSRD